VSAVGDRDGRVLVSPEDTPYGRVAVVTDPFGAVFGLIGPTQG